jgi:hypothetical protein
MTGDARHLVFCCFTLLLQVSSHVFSGGWNVDSFVQKGSSSRFLGGGGIHGQW